MLRVYNNYYHIKQSNSFRRKMDNQEDVESPVEAVEAVVALQIEDNLDSKGWASLVEDTNEGSTAKMPVERDAHEYNMTHKHRGKAVIFNHKKFTVDGLPIRNGTDRDRDRLSDTLKKLDFDVEIYEDLKLDKVLAKINHMAQDDHSERDCLLIAVFSHGIPNRIYAMDASYKKELLWDPFTADRCPSLAGKPKIFLIQACQGEDLDTGTMLRSKLSQSPLSYSATDSGFGGNSYKIPNRADFLMAFSTFPGYYSWRNQSTGSWFIQSICEVFTQHSARKDLVALLTMASRIVATRYESFVPNSHLDQMKQMPLITSTLLREVYFTPKCEEKCVGSIRNMTDTTTETVTKAFQPFFSLIRPKTSKPNAVDGHDEEELDDDDDDEVPDTVASRNANHDISSQPKNRMSLVRPREKKNPVEDA